MACAVHPRRSSIFIVSGQIVDELDTRDGSLRYRIISDLAEPIVRLEVCTGSRGHEYLLLLSAANELRVWDIESRFHLSAVRLGGGGEAGAPAGPGISLLAASTGHDRCVLFYARAGGWQVEALHLQRQLEKPGSPALLSVVEPKSFSGKAAVTALAVHPTLPLLASGTAEGTVTVHACPFLEPIGGAAAAGGGGAAAAAALPQPPPPPASAPAPTQQARLLFTACVNPEVALASGRVQRPPAAASAASVGAAALGSPALADTVVALAWHPTLPLLAALDACGRLLVWRVGHTTLDARHALLALRSFTVPSTVPEEYPRVGTSLLLHATLPYVYTCSHTPSQPHLPPHIGAWCYAHAALPAQPSPVAPALAALLTLASEEPYAAATAHLCLPPCLLPLGRGGGGGRGVGGGQGHCRVPPCGRCGRAGREGGG